MTSETTPASILAEEAEDIGSNISANLTMGDIIVQRMSRRDLVSGLLAVTAATLIASPGAVSAATGQALTNTTPNFNFPELAAGCDEDHHVAEGYDADVLISWGDAVLPDAPPFDPANASPQGQARQFGYNNDFLGFIPLDGRSDHGLLVANHEYVNAELMFPGLPEKESRQAAWERITRNQVDTEMMAHGGSIIEIQRTDGKWSLVPQSKYARRITAETPMRISGPAAGHDKMKTSTDPSGASVQGMLNNCSGALTPWGTWLTCEENFNGYFWGKAQLDKAEAPVALKRYGIPGEFYRWAKFHDRFVSSRSATNQTALAGLSRLIRSIPHRHPSSGPRSAASSMKAPATSSMVTAALSSTRATMSASNMSTASCPSALSTRQTAKPIAISLMKAHSMWPVSMPTARAPGCRSFTVKAHSLQPTVLRARAMCSSRPVSPPIFSAPPRWIVPRTSTPTHSPARST